MNGFLLGDWLVQPDLCRVSQHGEVVHLRPKVMDLLVCLASRQGEVVSKDQLLDVVWHTEFVSESALTRCITELRHALRDHADHPTIIETIHKRGYRVLVPVSPAPPTVVAQHSHRAAEATPVRPRHVSWRRLGLLAGFAVVIAAILLLLLR